MKKLLAVLLVLAMIFSFAACGSSGESAQQSQEQETEKPSETQNDVNSRDKNIGGIYSLTVPDDWERNDEMQAWLTPDGTVAVYFYTIATSYGDISMPAGLSIDDSNFEEEYVEHIRDKKCRTGTCKALANFYITDKCIGCTKCARNCPVNAITGTVKHQHVIDTAKCIKCGTCKANCPVGAIKEG